MVSGPPRSPWTGGPCPDCEALHKEIEELKRQNDTLEDKITGLQRKIEMRDRAITDCKHDLVYIRDAVLTALKQFV
jgi:predicted  nucleic acid-binding Zn-ribbon protein